MNKSLDSDIDLLLRILDHCDRIKSCIQRFGDDFQVYLQDLDYQDVIKMNIFQIGESVNSLSDEIKEEFSGIPWHEIYGMRNIIAHGYVKIKEERIWQTIQTDIPELDKQITEFLENSGIKNDGEWEK